MVAEQIIEFCCCLSCGIFTARAAVASEESWDWLNLIEGEERENVHRGTQGNYL